ncbi:MAG: hypothetical protein JGK01_11240 [Microcoleus sp. PH2017_03_ELD_O_A]|nr:hypothetical protein [Microcoleus sp. PH2017_03_ELD_O_A]MCC3475674.1 hypothetical protein [Microcoleus sp. PH2017_13_LAR_U_A]
MQRYRKEGRRKREEGRGKKEEGRGKKTYTASFLAIAISHLIKWIYLAN